MRVSRLFNLLCLLTVMILGLGCDDSNNPSGPGGTVGRGRIYVPNQADSTLYIYDARTLDRQDSLFTVLGEPHYMQFSPDGRYYYIIGRVFAPLPQIAKFSKANDSLLGMVGAPFGLFSTAMQISLDGSTGYVCDFRQSGGNGRVYRFDLDNMTFTDSTILAGAGTHDIEMASDGSFLVYPNYLSDDITLHYFAQDSTIFIDLGVPFTGTAQIGGYGIALDRRDSLAYILCRISKEIRVLDIAAGIIVDSIPIPIQGTTTSHGPTLGKLTPDGRTLWFSTLAENSVMALQLSDHRLTTFPVETPRTFGVAVDDVGGRIYVAAAGSPGSNGRIYIFNAVAGQKIDSIDVGRNSFGVGWSLN